MDPNEDEFPQSIYVEIYAVQDADEHVLQFDPSDEWTELTSLPMIDVAWIEFATL